MTFIIFGVCSGKMYVLPTEDVDHNCSANIHFTLAEWQPKDSAKVVLELVDRARFHGIVPRVVWAGGNFV